MVYAFGSGRTLIASCYLVGWGEFYFDFIKFLPYNKEFEQNASFNFHKKLKTLKNVSKTASERR